MGMLSQNAWKTRLGKPLREENVCFVGSFVATLEGIVSANSQISWKEQKNFESSSNAHTSAEDLLGGSRVIGRRALCNELCTEMSGGLS